MEIPKYKRAPRRHLAVPAIMLNLPTREQQLWSQLMHVLHDIARNKIIRESSHAA